MIKSHLQQKKTDRHKSNKTQLDKDIEASIKKLQTTLFSLTVTENIAKQFNTSKFLKQTTADETKFGRQQYLLPLGSVTLAKGGHEITMYYLLKDTEFQDTMSLYFDWGVSTKQIITANKQLLIGGRNKETITMIDYLIKRTKYMMEQQKKRGEYVAEIRYDDMFEKIKLPAPESFTSPSSYRTYLCRFKKELFAYLDYLTKTNPKEENMIHISGYQEYKNGIRILL